MAIMINEYLNNYKGYTYKEKLIQDCNKFLIENKAKTLGYLPRPCAVSLVSVVENGEVKSIGGSIPEDLILDQFGIIYNAYFRPSEVGQVNITVTDTGGVDRSIIPRIAFASNGMNKALSQALGTEIQVGQGSTLPARANVDIETVFAGAPESGRVGTGLGGYNSGLGQVTVSTVISPTSASGTVSESGLFWVLADNVTTVRTFMILHDLVSPGVSFVAAQAINVTYTWQL